MGNPLADALGVQRDEVIDQLRKIAHPLAQRRQLDLNYFQTIIEILPELPFRHLILEIYVGSGDEAHIDSADFVRTDRLQLPLLQNPEKLHLQRRWNISDLVEKESAPVRVLEQSRLGSYGPRECTFDMAERARTRAKSR